MAIKISTDSTVDFTPELIEKYNITVNPLYIVTDEGEFRDTLDIKPDDVYAYYDKTGKTATSSACNIDAYQKTFAELTADGSAVVHIGLSSELSSSFNNARLAAMEFDNVYVVDSKNLSTGIGLLVLKGAEMAAEGIDAKEIADKLTAMQITLTFPLYSTLSTFFTREEDARRLQNSVQTFSKSNPLSQ